MLTLYPAIDLKDGACVRLRRGEMADATVYSDDPAAQARAWQDAGCRWLHVVDLNGAFAGQAVNGAAVAAILTAAPQPFRPSCTRTVIAHAFNHSRHARVPHSKALARTSRRK